MFTIDPPMVFHVQRSGLRAEEAALQVRADDFIPFRLGNLEERFPGLDAEVVHQDVQPAELADYRLHHVVHLRRHAHVCADGKRLHAERGDFLVGEIGRRAIVDRNATARGRVRGQCLFQRHGRRR
jgi:hypothetical protein